MASSGTRLRLLAPRRLPRCVSLRYISAPAEVRRGRIDAGAATVLAQQNLVEAQERSAFLASMQVALDVVRKEAPAEVVAHMERTVQELVVRERERVHLVKRSWSDHLYEDGNEGNEATLRGFEEELVQCLQRCPDGLGDAEVLTNALDLAGAYKKNYKLDLANQVLLRCTRHAEARSGAWLVKYLNHMSQVRMKQARDAESLEMMLEMESLNPYKVTDPGASEFYETLYRNISSALKRMGREDDAAAFLVKMAQASQYHKPQPDWMDIWDLGVLVVDKAYRTKRWPEFHKARDLIAEALRQQRIQEPEDRVMRAKVLSNLGQCYLATEEFAQCELNYGEAYELFSSTVGKRSPLFGMQAWACGNLRCAEGRWQEALPYLGEALFVEVVSDGLSVIEMGKLVDQLLGALAPLKEDSSKRDLEPAARALRTLEEDPRWRHLPETLELAVLSHKFSLLSLSACRDVAHRYSHCAVTLLEAFKGDPQAQQWLEQARAMSQSVFQDGRLAVT